MPGIQHLAPSFVISHSSFVIHSPCPSAGTRPASTMTKAMPGIKPRTFRSSPLLPRVRLSLTSNPSPQTASHERPPTKPSEPPPAREGLLHRARTQLHQHARHPAMPNSTPTARPLTRSRPTTRAVGKESLLSVEFGGRIRGERFSEPIFLPLIFLPNLHPIGCQGDWTCYSVFHTPAPPGRSGATAADHRQAGHAGLRWLFGQASTDQAVERLTLLVECSEDDGRRC